MEKTTQSDLTLKFCDADSLTLIDSYFEQMNSSTIEVFNIPTVYIMHSEFHHSSPNLIGKLIWKKNILQSEKINIFFPVFQ